MTRLTARLTAPLVLGLLLVALLVPPFASGATALNSVSAPPVAKAAPVTAAPRAALTAAPTAAAPTTPAPAPGTPAAAAAAASAAPARITGKVVSVSGVTLVVKTPPAAAAPVTVTTNASTVVTINRTAAPLSYLRAGMAVVVTPGTGTAVTVAATAPVPKKVVGTIVSISATQVVIKPAPATAAAVTVAIDSGTVITLAGKAATVANIYPGMKATAHPWFGGKTSLLAVTAPMPKAIVGSIVSTNGTNIVIQPTAAAAARVTVGTDANTVFTLNGAGCTMSSLAAGQKVTAQPWYNGKALKVAATAAPAPVNCARCHSDGRTGNPPGHLPAGHPPI